MVEGQNRNFAYPSQPCRLNRLRPRARRLYRLHDRLDRLRPYRSVLHLLGRLCRLLTVPAHTGPTATRNDVPSPTLNRTKPHYSYLLANYYSNYILNIKEHLPLARPLATDAIPENSPEIPRPSPSARPLTDRIYLGQFFRDRESELAGPHSLSSLFYSLGSLIKEPQENKSIWT